MKLGKKLVLALAGLACMVGMFVVLVPRAQGAMFCIGGWCVDGFGSSIPRSTQDNGNICINGDCIIASDTDADGVKASLDKCPSAKGPSSNDGCPTPTISWNNDAFSNLDFHAYITSWGIGVSAVNPQVYWTTTNATKVDIDYYHTYVGSSNRTSYTQLLNQQAQVSSSNPVSLTLWPSTIDSSPQYIFKVTSAGSGKTFWFSTDYINNNIPIINSIYTTSSSCPSVDDEKREAMPNGCNGYGYVTVGMKESVFSRSISVDNMGYNKSQTLSNFPINPQNGTQWSVFTGWYDPTWHKITASYGASDSPKVTAVIFSDRSDTYSTHENGKSTAYSSIKTDCNGKIQKGDWYICQDYRQGCVDFEDVWGCNSNMTACWANYRYIQCYDHTVSMPSGY